MTEPRFEPSSILTALSAGGVRFVLIGGIASQYLGSPSNTFDVDVCYARDPENLRLLAGVLDTLQARRRGFPPGLPDQLDSLALRSGDVFTLATMFGPLDLLGSPDPGLDYEQLARTAVPFALEGHRVLVASIDDLIRMKRAAGRPKDRIELEVLGALREELDRRA